MAMAVSHFSIFEHDDAADWIGAFESDGLSSVKAALDLVVEADAGSYIEMTDAAPAMAAAEIVAAARDDDASRLPKSVLAAFKEHRGDVEDADLVSAALKSVRRVLKNSELKDQWDEAGDGEDWAEHVSELLERLKG
jgi:Domain of unknown function (DUF4259)